MEAPEVNRIAVFKAGTSQVFKTVISKGGQMLPI